MQPVQLVGIVNVTPDSFSDGGLYLSPSAAISHAKALFTQGASMVDIGAESTRPNAFQLSPEEEWHRLQPVLHELLPLYSGKISVDSFHPETIAKIAETYDGQFIVNDVTGFNNTDMIKVAARFKLPVIASHFPARFGIDIQAAHTGPLISDVLQVKEELLDRRDRLTAAGVPKARIILDPGIGFGKTPELNQTLLSFARHIPDHKVMVGYSRKRFLGEQRFELATNLIAARSAIASGAAYLRVHDVQGHSVLI